MLVSKEVLESYCSAILWHFLFSMYMLTCFACTLQNNAQFVINSITTKKYIHFIERVH